MKIRRRTRFLFGLLALLRRIRGAVNAVDVLTCAALGCLWFGIALVSMPLAFVVIGVLLILVTPIGAAIRIMVRGR